MRYPLIVFGNVALQSLGNAAFFHPAYNQMVRIVFDLPVLISALLLMRYVLKDYGVPPRPQ